MSDIFISPLSTLISPNQLPEELNFISSGISSLLSNVYYKDLLIQRSISTSSVSYQLDIVSYSEILKLNIPGTGLVLLLNPDLENPNTEQSVIPVSLTWSWGIQQYIRNFKVSSFSFQPQAFYELIFKIAAIQDDALLISAAKIFIENVKPLEKFAIDANTQYPGLNIPLPLNNDEEIAAHEILTAIEVYPDTTLHEILFQDYILAGSLNESLENLNLLFSPLIGYDAIGSIKELFIPKIAATLQLSAGLEIPRSVLIPVRANGEIEEDENIKTTLLFDVGEFVFSSNGDFGFKETLGVSFPASHPKAQIGRTGIIIEFFNAKLDLSKNTNIPEIDAAGYSPDFVGLYVERAGIEFTRFGQPDEDDLQNSLAIVGTDLIIGTGGFSGTIGLEAEGVLKRKFGNFAVELNEFSISFLQNSITGSYIAGELTIPKFTDGNGGPAKIAIQAAIKDNGDFSIRALPLQEPVKLTFPEVFELYVRSAEVGSVDGRFYIAISGRLDIIADLPVLGNIIPKNIEITKLQIWDNGDIEFEGGSFQVPKTFKLSVGPVNMEVSNISFGAYQRELGGVQRSYRYFSFDGMINTGRAGINTTGNGIKYFFSVDDGSFDHFIGIDRLEIDMAVPGNDKDKAAFLLNGFLSVSNPTQNDSVASTEYAGSVTFSMPKLRIAGSAGMRLSPEIPAFLVDINMELPNAVPIGGTGLGIYGIRGLIGQHYMPSKEKVGAATWYEYYKAKPEGVNIDKFAAEPGFSVGAGLSLATAFDSGKIFSSKLFVMLGLPDVFLIEGQAGLLRQRIGLDDQVDPPFRALIIFGDQSVRGNLSVNYNVPDNGVIFKLQGALDMAFFFNNASGWYLNVGKENPENERVRADILTLFKGHAYLMLSSRGIRAGAGIRFDFNKSFGPVGVGLGAFLNLGGFISVRPVQIGGYIQVGGYAYLKVWRFRLGLSVSIGLAVEAPRPFNITGSIEISIKVIFKRIRFRLDMSWRFNNDETEIRKAIPIIELPNETRSYLPATAVNILSNETFKLNYVTNETLTEIPLLGQPNGWIIDFELEGDKVTIPLDSFIDIELLKPVKPGSVLLGGADNQLPAGYTELVPPQKGVGSQVRHQFEITGLEIKFWNGNNWAPYNVYRAVSVIADSIGGTPEGELMLDTLKPGYWQFMEPGKFNKIRLLSQNMFSFIANNPVDDTVLDDSNFGGKDVFCFESILKEKSINWKEETLDTIYPNNQVFDINNFEFIPSGNIETSVKYNSEYLNNSLRIVGPTGRLELTLPQALAYIRFKFSNNSQNIKVTFLKTQYITVRQIFLRRIVAIDIPVAVLEAVREEASPVIELEGNTEPIDKIIIEFNSGLSPDYEGNVVIGSHYHLPVQYGLDGLPEAYRNLEADKAITLVTLYNRSFTGAEVLDRQSQGQPGTVAQWPMYSGHEIYSDSYAIISGSPDIAEGYYGRDQNNLLVMHHVYSFSSKADGLISLYRPSFKVENSSFAFELTAIFNPFELGVSTLLHKVKEDILSGYKIGYAVHLCRSVVVDESTVYTDVSQIPEYSIWFTCYRENSSWGQKVYDKFTIDCETSKITAKQYKNIFITVNRQSGELQIYLDQILKVSVPIPDELAVFDTTQAQTYLDEIVYVEDEIYSRLVDNDMKEERMLDEIRLLDDAANKVFQPVWRPDTTFAVHVKTMDVVEGQRTGEKHHFFGFKTAGPVGHFHEHSEKYNQLKLDDRQDEFKLANLQHYIDYERSYPDAQSRFDMGKPVFTYNPQVRLFFTKAYINAMYADWNEYNGLPEIKSSLDLTLTAPSGEVISRKLVWDEPFTVPVTDANLNTVPNDVKALYRLNSAAQECGTESVSFAKRVHRGAFSFPQLESNKLYTAVFNAVYEPVGLDPKTVEVHKYSFITSRYLNFLDQAGSFVLDNTVGAEVYSVNIYHTNFSDIEIEDRIKLILNGSTEEDSEDVLRYAEKFDRLLYGGLKVKNLERAEHTALTIILNTDPEEPVNQRILGLMLSSPEPFNDPKYKETILDDTVALSLTAGSVSLLPQDFEYIHSGNNSAIFITNTAMDLPSGEIQFKLAFKLFNGQDYDSLTEEYESPVVDLNNYIT